MDWDEELIKAISVYNTSIDHLKEAKQNKCNKKDILVEFNDKLFCFFERILPEKGYHIKKKTHICDQRIDIFLNEEMTKKYLYLKKVMITCDMDIEFHLDGGYYSKSEKVVTLTNIMGYNCYYISKGTCIYMITKKFSTPSEILNKFADMEILSNGKNTKNSQHLPKF